MIRIISLCDHRNHEKGRNEIGQLCVSFKCPELGISSSRMVPRVRVTLEISKRRAILINIVVEVKKYVTSHVEGMATLETLQSLLRQLGQGIT